MPQSFYHEGTETSIGHVTGPDLFDPALCFQMADYDPGDFRPPLFHDLFDQDFPFILPVREILFIDEEHNPAAGGPLWGSAFPADFETGCQGDH